MAASEANIGSSVVQRLLLKLKACIGVDRRIMQRMLTTKALFTPEAEANRADRVSQEA